MAKLNEPKAVLKVRKEDLPLLKEVIDSAKSKFKEVGPFPAHSELSSLPDTRPGVTVATSARAAGSAC